LAEFVSETESNSVIMGDFNLPGIDWREKTAVGGRDRQFLLACEEAGLELMDP
jgi:endonuclease/exonuclease/phosphatase family metal-dependent hydrolase